MALDEVFVSNQPNRKFVSVISVEMKEKKAQKEQ